LLPLRPIGRHVADPDARDASHQRRPRRFTRSADDEGKSDADARPDTGMAATAPADPNPDARTVSGAVSALDPARPVDRISQKDAAVGRRQFDGRHRLRVSDLDFQGVLLTCREAAYHRVRRPGDTAWRPRLTRAGGG